MNGHDENTGLGSSERTIQGLYQPQGACQSYWTLKAKVELSVFNEPKGEKVNE